MDAEASNSPQKPGTPGNYGNKSGKGQSTPMSEQPCKFFKSDHWMQSWSKLQVVSLLGGHRGQEQSMLGSVAAKITEKLNAKSRAMATTTNLRPTTLVWGEDVVVEIKMQPTTKRLSSKLQLEKVMMVQLQAQQLIKPPLVRALMVQDWVLRVTPLGLHLVQPRRWIRGEAPAATPATTELLAEATQLLKSLRMPNLKVMRLSKLESHAQMVLLDSGATHGLRPAASEEEWQSGTRTQVMLADGVTESLRLKPGTKVLLSDPLLRPENTSWIVPMGCLNELNYKLVWKDHMCHLYTKAGDKIDVELHNGCPYVAHEFGAKLLTVLEQHQIHKS